MKIRVYEVAKQLNIDPKSLVGFFQTIGVTDVKNHMSSVTPEAVELVKRKLEAQERRRTHDVIDQHLRRGEATVVQRRLVPKQPASADDAARLFVAGLHEDVTEQGLREVFERGGSRVLAVELWRAAGTGRLRRIGCVTMASPAEADAARQTLDGSLQAGSQIAVRPFDARRRGPASHDTPPNELTRGPSSERRTTTPRPVVRETRSNPMPDGRPNRNTTQPPRAAKHPKMLPLVPRTNEAPASRNTPVLSSGDRIGVGPSATNATAEAGARQRREGAPATPTAAPPKQTWVGDLLSEATARARRLPRDSQLRAALGLARIALQHAAIPLLEWVIEHGGDAARKPEFVELRAPSDGSLVDLLATGLVCAENARWNGVRGKFWEPTESSAARKFFGRPAPLHQVLNAFVAARNDGVEGHGIAGGEDPEALLSIVDAIVNILGPVLPFSDDDALLAIQSPDGRVTRLSYLRLAEGDLVCFRRSKVLRAGACRVFAQRQTDLLEKVDISWESNDTLQQHALHEPVVKYDYVETTSPSWLPLTRIPERLTKTFMGRSHEIGQLWDWFNDTDSKACIVYGDGGIGKTTLVIEFIQQLLAGGFGDPMWKPAMISYYSAKETRWGLNGLERLRFSQAGLTDAVTEIVRHLRGSHAIEDEWYKLDLPKLAQKLGGYLKEDWKVPASEHLLILDNTETLATQEEEITLLAEHIKALSRRVGRIIITSRRREKMEAAPIELPALDPSTAEQLLRRRATELGCDKLTAAGSSKLRAYAEGLEGWPLLLEVFVQTLAEKGLSPEVAFDRVRQMRTTDLGEFLFADAWARFSDRIKHMLLLMVRVGDNLDETLVRLCATEADVGLHTAEQALEESHGIARIQRIQGKLYVTFRKGFLDFCRDRPLVVAGAEVQLSESVSRVHRRYAEYIQVHDKEVAHRYGKAFRTPFSKMAFAARERGQYDECEKLFESAIGEDPNNGLLFDQYALFLLQNRTDPARALGKAEKATALAPESPDVWFTHGTILGRLKEVDPAWSSLQRALELGKGAHLVWLQVAHIYIITKDPREAIAREALRKARALSPRPTPEESASAFWRDLTRLERRLGITGD
ncbi:Translation initiation factor 2 [Labilithrix luteola]|uniref:Translation initiation factor 2 n=1 Tax=Labilithrix luteola TaxID=1391654 RepID=A0A0K1QEY8_9BACT|nr:translation initiation factor IF-2 N-terminal domain-containing protein [Labilithrix luteola]AKV04336.1 Translation initiation factor 2 [Labilithrix luteola]